MKTKQITQLLTIGIMIFVVSVWGCRESKPDRGQLLAALSDMKIAVQNSPDSVELQQEYVALLYQAGYFQEAKEVLAPLAQKKDCAFRTLFLMGEIEYLYGRYQNAEKYANEILERFSFDMKAKAQAYLLLFGICHQTNHYEKSHKLFAGMEDHIKLPPWDLMKSFGDTKPYRIEWAGLSQVRVPFVISDPLPFVEVEIRGTKILALVDTGGWYFILDHKIAESMGIEQMGSDVGTYAGGKKAETGYARLDSLSIGGITVSHLPISVLPLQPIAKADPEFEDKFDNYPFGGVIGTSFLQQFLATIDYINGTLILRPRSAQGKRLLKQYLRNRNITEVPFYLAEFHKMLVKGTLNRKNDLLFFVDCGLASEAAFIAPIQTLHYTGIPVPKTEVREGSMGGGGGGFATGFFAIQELRLGPLTQHDLLGEYGILTEEQNWSEYMDFIIDGVISDEFLKKYSWTMDFDDMKMIFTR